MARRFWIAELQIPPIIEGKLRQKHGLTADDVREACVPDQYERAAWEHHPVHGMRLLVVAHTPDGRRIQVILQPLDVGEGIWRLRSAWRTVGS